MNFTNEFYKCETHQVVGNNGYCPLCHAEEQEAKDSERIKIIKAKIRKMQILRMDLCTHDKVLCHCDAQAMRNRIIEEVLLAFD